MRQEGEKGRRRRKMRIRLYAKEATVIGVLLKKASLVKITRF